MANYEENQTPAFLKSKEKKGNKKGRKVVAAILVFALGAALFANWFINTNGLNVAVFGEQTTNEEALGQAQYVSATTASNNYFRESRLKREKAHDAAMDELNKVIDDAKATSDEKKTAINTYAKLSERLAMEADIETLIAAKGISESVVVLGEQSCEVLVPQKELNDTIALQIKEIVTNKAGTDPAKISVSAVK